MFNKENNQFHINDVEIKLQRGLCFGNCPSYSLTILGYGKIFYFGFGKVSAKGLIESSIEKDKVFAILKKALEIGFFGLKDIYLGDERITMSSSGDIDHRYFPRTDGPTYTVSIKIGNEIKNVIDYQGAPESLREFEDFIDEICDSNKWTGVNDSLDYDLL